MRLAFSLLTRDAKFVDCRQADRSSEALSILARIAEVYRIEAKLRGESVRYPAHGTASRDSTIMRELKVQLTELSGRGVVKSALGKAVSYCAQSLERAGQPSWRMAGSSGLQCGRAFQ